MEESLIYEIYRQIVLLRKRNFLNRPEGTPQRVYEQDVRNNVHRFLIEQPMVDSSEKKANSSYKFSCRISIGAKPERINYDFTYSLAFPDNRIEINSVTAQFNKESAATINFDNDNSLPNEKKLREKFMAIIQKRPSNGKALERKEHNQSLKNRGP